MADKSVGMKLDMQSLHKDLYDKNTQFVIFVHIWFREVSSRPENTNANTEFLLIPNLAWRKSVASMDRLRTVPGKRPHRM